MERYRCGRCQAVLAAVPAPPGAASDVFLDPLVERRLHDAVARHRLECESLPPSDPSRSTEDGGNDLEY